LPYDEETAELFKILVNDISQLDVMDLDLKDLTFVGRGCLHFEDFIANFSVPLRKLSLKTFELCEMGGVE
jgi:hypothetical protein